MTKDKINDFVIRFTNVNGTGSASANDLFARSIFRMGIPVSPKNIFPSNIQGLPTWYEVRVSEKGYLGKRDNVDFAIAINGKTLKKDFDSLSSGGYFLYDSTRPLPETFNRQDVEIIGIPLTELANAAFDTARLKQLLKNIIYVGALAYFVNLDFDALKASITKQFAKKPKLAEPNLQALEIGFSYAKNHFGPICHLRLERRENLLGNSILVDGNTATGLGAVYAGATVAGWYPITPSTSVVEAYEKYCTLHRVDEDGKNKFAVVQAEDELAALGIVIGASWNGARAFTATSGPGLSLMSEFLGLAYFAEIPTVLIDVQRAGPSTGMPTRTQQSDVMAAAYASHGDTKQVVLFPGTPKECFDLTAKAFDLAERLQTPVIVLSDLDLGMNKHISEPFSWNKGLDRGKVLDHDDLEKLHEKWGRYLDLDGDGICYRTLPGTHPEKGSYFTRGTSHNEFSGYTEDNLVYQEGMERLLKKWETGRSLMPKPQTRLTQSCYGIIYYGTSNHSCREALDILNEQDILISSQQVYSFPFHQDTQDFLDQHEKVFVVEQNRDGQLRSLLIDDLNVGVDKLEAVLHYDGMPISADFIVKTIQDHLNLEA